MLSFFARNQQVLPGQAARRLALVLAKAPFRAARELLQPLDDQPGLGYGGDEIAQRPVEFVLNLLGVFAALEVIPWLTHLANFQPVAVGVIERERDHPTAYID